MKILVVSQYFWPENFRINDLSAELVARGHEVTVLTGKPNYPEGYFFPEFEETPERYSEYQGVNIVRIPMFSRGRGSSFKLILNYLSYAISASIIGLYKLRNQEFDVVFVCQLSPITIAFPALVYRKLYKKPVIMWILDLWPETLEAIGVVKSKHLLSLVGKLVSFIYNRCELVLGQSKSFYDGIARYCTDKSKIKYFPSWPESIFLAQATSTVKEIDQHEGVFKILFAGNIGDAQDFPSILLAAKLLKSQQIKAKIFIVGDGRAYEWVKSEIINQKLHDHVYLLGRHPLDAMPSFFASADSLLVTLQESPVFTMTIPGKVQSYMAAGKPILTMLSGEGSRIIDEAECGYTANSGDYEEFVKNIFVMSRLKQDDLMNLGHKAKLYAETEFNRDILITQLEKWFVEINEKSRA
jgi:colanic acid biosynthesis glycosyl transferase WcaI